jgi:hypothetical protein
VTQGSPLTRYFEMAGYGGAGESVDSLQGERVTSRPRLSQNVGNHGGQPLPCRPVLGSVALRKTTCGASVCTHFHESRTRSSASTLFELSRPEAIRPRIVRGLKGK